MKLIIWNDDWADEFDIYGISLLTDDLYDKMLKGLSSLEAKEEYENLFDEVYFGTNEFMEYSLEDMMFYVKGAKDISQEYANILIETLMLRQSWHYAGLWIAGQEFSFNILNVLEDLKLL
jgi:hypothetical protein